MKVTKKDAVALDKAAIGVSLLCVVHCLSIPFILALGPALNLWFWGSEGFHAALLAVVLPLSLVAFWRGYRTHRNARLWTPGLMGLGIVTVTAILEHFLIGPGTAAVMTSGGGLFLIAAHLMNLKDQRACCSP